jgi:hypothetical protein
MRRSPSGADQAHGGGPVYDAQIDHPALGALGIDYLPTLLAPDPGGLLARMGSHVLPVDPVSVPVQRSPLTHWFRGFPYPGPPATVTVAIDVDSAKWWGRTGQGMLVWSSHTEAISADLPPAIPQDMVQHVDAWHTYMGGYPSIARNRPTAFGDQVPVLNP